MVSGVEVKGTYKFYKVTLSAEGNGEGFSDTFPYLVFQGLFPVTDPDVERQEVNEWAISVAFPLEGRASSQDTGDIFCFLPTELRTGFPFIVNADFILTSSRESIRFNADWNSGILNCVPVAFEVAFSKMIPPLRSNSKFLSDRRDAYKFLPVKAVGKAYRCSPAGSMEDRNVRQKLEVQPERASNIQELEKVRAEIFERVRKHKYIFLSSPGNFDVGLRLSMDYNLPAKSCWFIHSSFRKILESAARWDHPAPLAVLKCGSKFGIIDEYVQEGYASGLAALGVSHMTVAQYESFLRDSNWLLNLPDRIYIQVLSFVAFELKLDPGNLAKLDLIRIRVHKLKRTSVVSEDFGKTNKLASFTGLGTSELLYTSSAEDADWIYSWVEEFSAFDIVEVLPAKTSEALIEARNSEDLIAWIRKRVSLTEMSVHHYSRRLQDKLAAGGSPNKWDHKFSVLVLQFLYSAIQDKKLLRDFVVQKLRLRNVLVFDQTSGRERSATAKMREERWILLPKVVSKWPNLFTFSCFNSKNVITLSDKYLEPQCSLVEKIVSQSPGPDSMLQFMKDTLRATDLPQIKLPPGDQIIKFNDSMTISKSLLMLEWLRIFLPSRQTTKIESKNDGFLRSVREFAWVKTYHHGWKSPSSVFFSANFFEKRFTADDLPFLDVGIYGLPQLTDFVADFVFEELELVTDVSKGQGCAAVVTHFSKLSAKQLSLEAVTRFYKYFHECVSRDQIRSVKIWIPAAEASEDPIWEDPADCIVSDELDIFADSSVVILLDKIYNLKLLPKFFSSKLQVPEKASGANYCRVWLEWSRLPTDVVIKMEEGGSPQNTAFVSKVKAQHVLKDILRNWQDSSKSSSGRVSKKDSNLADSSHESGFDSDASEESADECSSDEDDGFSMEEEAMKAFSTAGDLKDGLSIEERAEIALKDCSTAGDPKDGSSNEDEEQEELDEEVWKAFLSGAWVPVTPMGPVVNKPVSKQRKEANDTVSIVPPREVLIADNEELAKDFSKAAGGKLNFVWLKLPHLSSQQEAKLFKMYLEMGVRKLSEMVTCEVRIPPDTWKKNPPRGTGLICEGLFRCVLAYLCKNGKKHGIPAEARQSILSPLVSATEVVLGKPFEKALSLRMETWTSPVTVKEDVFMHFDKVEGKLYSLRKTHPSLKAAVKKRMFNAQFVNSVASGILSEHTQLVEGLIVLLTPLCDSGFANESVEYECKTKKLSIFPRDEKMLRETIELRNMKSG